MRAVASSAQELAGRFGIERDACGIAAWSGVARLLRQAVSRWGLVRSVAARRFAERTLEAAGFERESARARVKAVLELMVELRDVETVYVDRPASGASLSRNPDDSGSGALSEGEASVFDTDLQTNVTPAGIHLAAASPHYVIFGARAFLCGTKDLPRDSTHAFGHPGDRSAVVRWIDVGGGQLAALEEAGFDEWETQDWLGPPGWTPHMERRDVTGLTGVAAFWSVLERAFERFAIPVNDASLCAVVAGRPGSFFGTPMALDGRWCAGSGAPSGLWCGVLRGHNVRHLRPVLAEARGGAVVRAMELFDFDELRWAVVARGVAVGEPEVALVRGEWIDFTFPLPSQWRRLAALCSVEKWRWTLPPWVEPSNVEAALAGILFQ